MGVEHDSNIYTTSRCVDALLKTLTKMRLQSYLSMSQEPRDP